MLPKCYAKRWTKEKIEPAQNQDRPGKESKMAPIPLTEPVIYPAGKLAGKVALITGGDSGIGKAVALLFAKEGAHVVISYLNEDADALQTQAEVEAYNVKCILIKGDLGVERHCKKVISQTVKKFDTIDILVNNAALHWESDGIEDITTDQLMKTFHSNYFSYFWITKFALPHMKKAALSLTLLL